MSVVIEPAETVGDFEIISVAPHTPSDLALPGVLDEKVEYLRRCVATVGTDVSTPASRDKIRTAAAKVARSKTFLDGILKDWLSDAKKKLADVDRLRADMREKLDDLKDQVRAPLTAYEQAETVRIANLRADLQDMAILGNVSPLDATADEIRAKLANLDALYAPDWQEFAGEAKATYETGRRELEHALAVRTKMDAEAAELERLRLLQAERDRQDAALRAKAAEAARVEVEVRRRQQAAEAAQKAESERAAHALADANARAAQEKAAREAAERRAKEEAAQAAKAAQEAQEAAVAAERERIEAEQQAVAEEAARLAADEAHRDMIHAEIEAAIRTGPTTAGGIVAAIAAGKIPHVRIEY